MIPEQSGKSVPIAEEKQRLDVIKQIRLLVDEGIQILIDDGILSCDEIDALSFRINEYLTRESVFIHRKLSNLDPKICTPIKRPRRPQKLNVHWYDMVHAYHSVTEDSPH